VKKHGLVDIGDSVAKDQTLALIETPELDDQVTRRPIAKVG